MKILTCAIIQNQTEGNQRVAGMLTGERLRACLKRLDIEVVTFEDSRILTPQSPFTNLLIVDAQWVYDIRTLLSVLAHPSSSLAFEGALTKVGSEHFGPSMLGSISSLPKHPFEELATYDAELRKKRVPICFDSQSPNLVELEDRLLSASEKGTNDWVALHLHSKPQNWMVRKLWGYPTIVPNLITIAGFLGSLVAALAFSFGFFLLPTLWGNFQGIVDGVDGKLARTTLRDSKFGYLLDHICDQIYEPLWYLCMGVGVSSVGSAILLLVFYAMDRISTGWFAKLHEVQMHDYRKWDRIIRTYGARRNNNLFLLLGFSLVGLFSLGFRFLVLYTIATGLTKAVRFIWIQKYQLKSDVEVSA